MPPTRSAAQMSIFVIMGVLTNAIGESATFVRSELMTEVSLNVGGRFTFDIEIISSHVGGRCPLNTESIWEVVVMLRFGFVIIVSIPCRRFNIMILYINQQVPIMFIKTFFIMSILCCACFNTYK